MKTRGRGEKENEDVTPQLPRGQGMSGYWRKPKQKAASKMEDGTAEGNSKSDQILYVVFIFRTRHCHKELKHQLVQCLG